MYVKIHQEQCYQRLIKPLCLYCYLSILRHFAEHYNGLALVLPDHLPEVIDCVLQWHLSSNVGSVLSVALGISECRSITSKQVIVRKFCSYINETCIDVIQSTTSQFSK